MRKEAVMTIDIMGCRFAVNFHRNESRRRKQLSIAASMAAIIAVLAGLESLAGRMPSANE